MTCAPPLTPSSLASTVRLDIATRLWVRYAAGATKDLARLGPHAVTPALRRDPARFALLMLEDLSGETPFRGTLYQFGEAAARRYGIVSFVEFSSRLDIAQKKLFVFFFLVAGLLWTGDNRTLIIFGTAGLLLWPLLFYPARLCRLILRIP